MSTHLMTSRRFAPLFWCQFFSAFNDNFLKNALGFLIVFHIGGDGAASLNTLALAIFIAPFFILSGLGGQLADRFDKAVITRYLKLVEIFVVGVAIAGFTTRSLSLLFVALALFGIIAALFGPIKYGILPDHLAREDLPAGNALVEAARPVDLQTPINRRHDPWPQTHAIRRGRQIDRGDAAKCQRSGRHRSRPDVGRACSRDDQLHRRLDQHPRGLSGR
jgi:hypothetical protein